MLKTTTKDTGTDNDADLIAACFARWPDLARYADTARIGRGMVWDAEQQCGVEREGVLVVVTVEGDNA